MPNTLIKIADYTATGSNALTFSNIPDTYTDLKIVYSIRTSAGAGYDALTISFNGGSTFGTSYVTAIVADPNPSAGSATGAYIGGTNNGFTANLFAVGDLYITNYTSTNYKNVRNDIAAENAATTSFRYLNATIVPLTSAITSITLGNGSSGAAWLTGSTASLYGISKT